MKKANIKKLALSLILFSVGNAANAALIDMQNANGHVVYDNTNQQYWYWDLTAFTSMTYNQQTNAITALNNTGNQYFNLGGWHMATITDIENLWWSNSHAEKADAFNAPFVPPSLGGNGDSYSHRFDNIFPPIGAGAHNRTNGWIDMSGNFSGGWDWGVLSQGDYDTWRSGFRGAWTVTDAPAPVPLPAAIVFFASGIAGLAAAKIRNSKS